MMSDGRTNPKKDQFIIADSLREMAMERSAFSKRERERALDPNSVGSPQLAMEHAWALSQQAQGLWEAAHAVNNLDLDRLTHAPARESDDAGSDRG